jgi:hypothetical protein
MIINGKIFIVDPSVIFSASDLKKVRIGEDGPFKWNEFTYFLFNVDANKVYPIKKNGSRVHSIVSFSGAFILMNEKMAAKFSKEMLKTTAFSVDVSNAKLTHTMQKFSIGDYTIDL